MMICERHKFSERCFENLISMPIKSSVFIICTSRWIKMYHEADFYSVCLGAGGKRVTSLHRMGYFMGYLYLASIRTRSVCADQGVDAEIKSRGTFLNMFSLIVTQETDSVMGLAGAGRGGRCLFRRNLEGREGYWGSP